MIIGHLPAGYLASKLLFRHFDAPGVTCVRFFWAGLLGAIAPDLDMFYFYLVDHRLHHHHTYFTHFPLVWGALLLLAALWLHVKKARPMAALAFIFALNGSLHLLLDTIVGDIWWLAPFVDKPFSLFTVPALYQPWWLNFLLHWSFAIEVGVLLTAAALWYRSRR
jgi:inner membrane protein